MTTAEVWLLVLPPTLTSMVTKTNSQTGMVVSWACKIIPVNDSRSSKTTRMYPRSNKSLKNGVSKYVCLIGDIAEIR